MYALLWRNVSVLHNSGNKHQNNPLVSAETVRHSSAYIILYILAAPSYSYDFFLKWVLESAWSMSFT